jgi:hypothetical protein
MWKKASIILFALFSMQLVNGARAAERTQLGFEELMAGQAAASALVENQLFIPEEAADKALHGFSAAIHIPEHNMRTEPQVIEPKQISGKSTQLMPNGLIGFRLGNGGDKPLEQMTIIADKIRPFDQHSGDNSGNR